MSLAYICAACGGFGYAEIDSIDSGTTLTCDSCGGKTVIDLNTPEQRKADYLRLNHKRDLAIARSMDTIGLPDHVLRDRIVAVDAKLALDELTKEAQDLDMGY
jgi:DNA-directed RNA polymerase subunit RPC12/RpoP